MLRQTFFLGAQGELSSKYKNHKDSPAVPGEKLSS